MWITFSELTTARLADFDPAINAWWISDAGLRLLGIEAEPPTTYQVCWKYDGANRAAPNAGLTLEAVRKEVKFAIGQLRAGYPISAIVVVDETTGQDATEEAGRGLIPHADELKQLEHRAAVLAGLAEVIDYLRANPAVPVPRYPELGVVFGRGYEDSAGRDAVYVAAAALGVESTSRAAVYGGVQTTARRRFGVIEYTVTHCSQADRDGYEAWGRARDSLLAEQSSAEQ